MSSNTKSNNEVQFTPQFSCQLKRACKLFLRTQAPFKYLFLSIFLSISLIFVNISSVFILFILIDGIIGGTFHKATQLPGYSYFIQFLPASISLNSQNFLLLIMGVYLSTLIKNILFYGAGLSTALQSQKTASSLRMLILERYLMFSRDFYQKHSNSFLQGIITKSSTWVRNHLSAVQIFTTQLLSSLAFFIMMVKISWVLSLVAIGVLPLVNYFATLLGVKIRNRALIHNRSRDDFSNKIENIISHMKWVQLYGKEDFEKNNFEIYSKKEVNDYFKMERLSQLIDPMHELSATTSLLVIASLISLLASQIGLKANQIFLFVYLVNKVVPVFHYANRLRRVVAEGSAITEQIEWVFNDSDKAIPKFAASPCLPLSKKIEFNNLNFSFPDGAFKLQNISFTIGKGEKIAIIGHTGAGKSTLASLLLRYYEVPPGNLLYDNNDISDYNIRSYRSKFAFVSQDLDLLNGSIRENLNYGLHTEATDSQLKKLLSEIEMDATLTRLGRGLDSMVGVRGSKLSAGECQRISIARALLIQPEILILDEPTSNLDSKTELQVLNTIEAYTKNSTLIIIAHRLSTIINVDRVLVMKHGQLVSNIKMKEFHKTGFSLESLYTHGSSTSHKLPSESHSLNPISV